MKRLGRYQQVVSLAALIGLDCDCLGDEKERNGHCELVTGCVFVGVSMVWREMGREGVRSCALNLGIAVEKIALVLIPAAAKVRLCEYEDA
jgi:hypothetical protein